MSPGGVVLVDDCPETYSWKARLGYSKFMSEIGQPPHYDSGMGVFETPLAASAQSGFARSA